MTPPLAVFLKCGLSSCTGHTSGACLQVPGHWSICLVTSISQRPEARVFRFMLIKSKSSCGGESSLLNWWSSYWRDGYSLTMCQGPLCPCGSCLISLWKSDKAKWLPWHCFLVALPLGKSLSPSLVLVRLILVIPTVLCCFVAALSLFLLVSVLWVDSQTFFYLPLAPC